MKTQDAAPKKVPLALAVPSVEWKGALKSKTVWAGVVMAGSSLLGLAHYTVTVDQQASIVSAIVDIVGTVSGLVAIWGRVVATHQIDKVL